MLCYRTASDSEDAATQPALTDPVATALGSDTRDTFALFALRL